MAMEFALIFPFIGKLSQNLLALKDERINLIQKCKLIEFDRN